MTENQKIAARYGLIMQQTALVQGDLARTSESGSNQLRRMGSEFATLTQMIGTEFEPAATSALTWINNEGFPMVTAGLQTMKVEWGKMSVGSQEHVLQLAGSLLAGGPLLMGLSFAYKAVVGFREAWKVLRLSAVAEIVAIGGALYGLIRAGAAFGKMKDEGLDVFTAWSNAGSDVDQTIGGWINGMKDMGDELLKNTGLSMDLEGAIGTYGDILAENKAKTEASRKALEGQANALDIVKGAWNSGGAAVANGGAKMKAVADQIKQAMNEAKNAMQSLANTPLAGERAADDKVFEIEQQIKRWSVERSIVLQNLQNKPKDAVEAEAWDLENRINGWRELAQRAREEAELLFDPQKREIQRLLPYQELSADAIKAGILQQLTIYKAAERGVIAANPELAPMAGLGQIMQTPAVLADVTKQGADVATVLGKGITDGLSTSGFGQKLIEALTDQLKKVKIDLGPWHLSSAGFELHLTVTAPQSGGSGSSSGSGETVPGYASGTPYVPYTGLALVHQGEAIIPASQNNGTGSGDVNINFTGDIHVRNDGDIRRIAKEIYNEFAKSGNALNLARSRGA